MKVSEIKETDYHQGVETYDLRNCPKILLRVSSAAQLEIQSLSNVLEFDMMILGRTPTFRGRIGRGLLFQVWKQKGSRSRMPVQLSLNLFANLKVGDH